MAKIKRAASVFCLVMAAGFVTLAVAAGWAWLTPAPIAFLGGAFTLTALVFVGLSLLPE